MRLVFAAAAAVMLPACSTLGEVGIAGRFAEPQQAPAEIRYMLHQGYGLSALDMAMSAKELVKPGVFRSIYPDAAGAFVSEPERVIYHTPPMKAPKPAYWLSFSNEKDVLYGMGWTKNGFDYRTLVEAGRAPVDRTTTCWLIKSGEFIYPPEKHDHAVTLQISLERNPAATKPCA